MKEEKEITEDMANCYVTDRDLSLIDNAELQRRFHKNGYQKHLKGDFITIKEFIAATIGGTEDNICNEPKEKYVHTIGDFHPSKTLPNPFYLYKQENNTYKKYLCYDKGNKGILPIEVFK